MSTNKKRILLVCPVHEPAWNFGGVVTSNASLCHELARIGYDVCVYTTNASGQKKTLEVPIATPVNIKGTEVFYFNSSLGKINPFASRDLIDYLKKTVTSFDLVYVVALWQWIGIQTVRLCHEHNIPCVMSLKGGFSRELRKKSSLKKTLFKRLFLQKALDRVDALHLSNEQEKVAAGNWIQNQPIIYSLDAVNPDHFQYDPVAGANFRKKYDLAPEANVILYAGRMDWKKRIDLLIESLVEKTNWHLVLAGVQSQAKGPELTRLAEDRGISDRVVWTGLLTPQELNEAYCGCNLLSLVSENENFGMVAVEAMMCGLPVMLSDQVGICEIVKDQKFALVSSIDRSGIGSALTRYQMQKDQFSDPSCAQQIRQFAIDHFSPQVTAGRFAEEIETLLRHTISGKNR